MPGRAVKTGHAIGKRADAGKDYAFRLGYDIGDRDVTITSWPVARSYSGTRQGLFGRAQIAGTIIDEGYNRTHAWDQTRRFLAARPRKRVLLKQMPAV